jgi:hypothetical protein
MDELFRASLFFTGFGSVNGFAARQRPQVLKYEVAFQLKHGNMACADGVPGRIYPGMVTVSVTLAQRTDW